MRLLDRYLLRELLTPLCYCGTGFLIFWISFDLFSELDDFQNDRVPWIEVARYYAFKFPEFLVLITPMALLLALLYALTHHSRHNELTAIRTAGVSMLRLSVPYLAIGFLTSLGLFAVNELGVPPAAQAAEEIISQSAQPGEADGSGRWETVSFRNEAAERIWTIHFNLDTFEMKNPSVEWRSEEETRQTLDAAKAVRTNGVWVFHDVIYRSNVVYRSIMPLGQAAEVNLDTTEIRTNRMAMPEFTETPEQIQSEIKINRLTSLKARAAKEAQLSIREILDYLALHPNLDAEKRALLFTQFHGRLAMPWNAFVVVLIAIPFGAAFTKRNAFLGVASSILICFAYFIVMRMGLALGTGQYVPPWLGAWAPHILFSAAALCLAMRVR